MNGLAMNRSIPTFKAHCFVALSEFADMPIDKCLNI
jgi:hypothetical protein